MAREPVASRFTDLAWLQGRRRTSLCPESLSTLDYLIAVRRRLGEQQAREAYGPLFDGAKRIDGAKLRLVTLMYFADLIGTEPGATRSVSVREIATATGVGVTAAGEVIRGFVDAGILEVRTMGIARPSVYGFTPEGLERVLGLPGMQGRVAGGVQTARATA